MRMRTTGAVALMIAMVLTGCHPDWWLGGDDGSKTGTPVAFEMLARGEYSGITDRSDRVINTEAEWDALWKQVHSIMIPMPERPDVDFSKHSVIAVFQGEHSSGGHSITIRSMEKTSSGLHVSVRNTVPSAGCIVSMALTQPYHIVMVEKVTTPVTFGYTTEASCNGN